MARLRMYGFFSLILFFLALFAAISAIVLFVLYSDEALVQEMVNIGQNGVAIADVYLKVNGTREGRIVTLTFAATATPFTCPTDAPIQVPQIRFLTHKWSPVANIEAPIVRVLTNGTAQVGTLVLTTTILSNWLLYVGDNGRTNFTAGECAIYPFTLTYNCRG